MRLAFTSSPKLFRAIALDLILLEWLGAEIRGTRLLLLRDDQVEVADWHNSRTYSSMDVKLRIVDHDMQCRCTSMRESMQYD